MNREDVMVTPTTASAAEATPELPGTLGKVRTVSATPRWCGAQVGHRRGPGVPLIHGDHPVSPPVASTDQPRSMLAKTSAHRTVSGDLLDDLAIRDMRPAGDPRADGGPRPQTCRPRRVTPEARSTPARRASAYSYRHTAVSGPPPSPPSV